MDLLELQPASPHTFSVMAAKCLVEEPQSPQTKP